MTLDADVEHRFGTRPHDAVQMTIGCLRALRERVSRGLTPVSRDLCGLIEELADASAVLACCAQEMVDVGAGEGTGARAPD